MSHPLRRGPQRTRARNAELCPWHLRLERQRHGYINAEESTTGTTSSRFGDPARAALLRGDE